MTFSLRHIIMTIFLTLLLIAGFQVPMAQESTDGQHDIAQLLSEAKTRFDMSNEDAVILFDSEKIRLDHDKKYQRYFHRIIWINSDVAINRYGDHRIAYDAVRCTLNIETVRTWRDGKWWETGPTGIVETTPDELKDAYDYSNIRETMLLHNGIELPCILEVAYSIEDKEPFRLGWEGYWTFARREPVVESWFGFELPSGWWPNIFERPAVPAPEKTTDSLLAMDSYIWKRGPYDAIPYPYSGDPGDTESHIFWSTWKDWPTFGLQIRNTFDPAAIGNEELDSQLDSLLEQAYTDQEKARLVAKFINDKTRFIDYPWQYWLMYPRPAVRTYNTAYTHRLDRIVLAAALFAHAGLNTTPAFISYGYDNIEESVPTLARMKDIGLWLSGNELAAYYDPAESAVLNGPVSFLSHAVWLPGIDEVPNIRINGADKTSLNDIRIELQYDFEKDSLVGTGYFYADNYFNPYDELTGLHDEADEYFAGLVKSIFERGAQTGHNPASLSRTKVTMGFRMDVALPEKDEQDRIRLTIGEPSSGLFTHLPEDLELYMNERTSPVNLPCPLSQRIELRLKLDNLDLIHYPENDSLINDAGKFSIRAERKDDRLIITRQLVLAKRTYPPKEWPLLRNLLLADRNEKNGVLLLTISEDADDK